MMKDQDQPGPDVTEPRPPVPPGGGSVQRRSRAAEARRRAFGQLSSVVLIIAAISVYVHFAPKRTATKTPPTVVAPFPPPRSMRKTLIRQRSRPEAESLPEPVAAEPVPAPELDRAAVARAEEALDAASRDRARADHRAAESARKLTMASTQAALDASRARKLAFLVRDPSTRIRRPPPVAVSSAASATRSRKKCRLCGSFPARSRPRS